jgi:hypothetical protein
MVFELHGTLGSPEAGFNKGATVVAGGMVVVVAMIGAGVVALFASGVDEQAVIDSAKRTTEATRFT